MLHQPAALPPSAMTAGRGRTEGDLEPLSQPSGIHKSRPQSDGFSDLFLSFFLLHIVVDKRIWQRDLIYPLGLSSTAVSLLKPFF